MGNLNIRSKVVEGNNILFRKSAVFAHKKNICKLRNHFIGKPFFFKHFLKHPVVVFGIANDSQLVIVVENIVDGALRVGFFVKEFCGIFAYAF